MPVNTKPYGMPAPFERAITLLACQKQSFYAKAAHALVVEALTDPTNRLLVAACHAIHKDTGRGPDGIASVLMRVRRWNGDGQIDYDAVTAVQDALIEDVGVTEEGAAAELLPLLKRRMRRDAADQALSDVAAKGDMAKTAELIEKADALGANGPGAGAQIGEQTTSLLAQYHSLQRMPTGIMELDSLLDGGLWCGALGVVIGAAGEGKSVFLTQVSAQAFMLGYTVAIATLELPMYVQHARFLANLTGVPIAQVLGLGDKKTFASVVGGKLDVVVADSLRYGRGTPTATVQEFAAYATKMSDITTWVEGLEQTSGRAVDLIVIDYADKVGAKKKESSDYDTGREVFEGLRLFAQDRKKYSWTASQSRRKSDKKRKVKDLDDVADSMHKVRVADVVVTLNSTDADEGEDREIGLFLAKNRMGESHKSVGPYPPNFALGRLF